MLLFDGHGRGDVDQERIALVGISQVGYWVPRALAFERRIAAAVADPGVLDVSTSWWQHLPGELRAVWESGEREAFDQYLREGLKGDPDGAATWAWRAKPYGIDSPFDLLTEIGRYTLAPVVDQSTTPPLITDPEGESFWPGQSEQLHEALTGPKELVRFTEAEGADLHCEPLGRAVLEQRVFDWIDARLGTGG
ncbi:alpha/beta hydrolase family protein [Streptomyces wuyuanensis]|uniref:alpha/beta hydrolase family protein n=1 Tax=Streptomyces wuyuanensis TaxID=1196353 RepID=UPI0037FC77FA